MTILENLINSLPKLADLVNGAQLIVAGCAVITLWKFKEQLQRQKKEFELSSQRDALKVTVEQIRYYSSMVIPLYNSVQEKIKKEKIVYFEKNAFYLEGGKVCSKTNFIDDSDIEKIKNLLNDLGNISNRIEDFSIYLVSGVANQEFAFNAMSDVFCSEVEHLFPFYAFTQSQGIPATLQLYQMWRSRLKEVK